MDNLQQVIGVNNADVKIKITDKKVTVVIKRR